MAHPIGRGHLRALVVVIGWSVLLMGPAPAMAADRGIATFSAGAFHNCAVRTDGAVWCWGYGGYGQLGDGTTGDTNESRTSPVQVLRGSSTLKGVSKVAVGSAHSCAMRTDGTVWCWGYGAFGQLGDGTAGPGHHRTKAVQVRRGSGHLTGVTQIAAGGSHACALRTDGSVVCWGSAAQGQVGDGTTGDAVQHLRTSAVRVRRGSGYLDKVVAIAAGDSHTCALRTDRSVWCWGHGAFGQLGDGSSVADHHRTKATRVKRGSGYLTKASGIAAGAYHTCARRTDGTAWCWGLGQHGQLGDGTTGGPGGNIRSKPVQVLRASGVLTRVAGIAAGAYHTCARRSDGSAYCWGVTRKGLLGDGTTGDPADPARPNPVRVVRPTSPFTGVRKLDGGVSHTCALRTDRSLWCWGANASGELGRGTRDEDPHPYPRRVLFPWAG